MLSETQSKQIVEFIIRTGVRSVELMTDKAITQDYVTFGELRAVVRELPRKITHFVKFYSSPPNHWISSDSSL